MKDRISICGKAKSLGLAASSHQDEENERRRHRSCGGAVKMERGDRGEAVMKKVLILYGARLIKNCTDGLCVCARVPNVGIHVMRLCLCLRAHTRLVGRIDG